MYAKKLQLCRVTGVRKETTIVQSNRCSQRNYNCAEYQVHAKKLKLCRVTGVRTETTVVYSKVGVRKETTVVHSTVGVRKETTIVQSNRCTQRNSNCAE